MPLAVAQAHQSHTAASGSERLGSSLSQRREGKPEDATKMATAETTTHDTERRGFCSAASYLVLGAVGQEPPDASEGAPEVITITTTITIRIAITTITTMTITLDTSLALVTHELQVSLVTAAK